MTAEPQPAAADSPRIIRVLDASTAHLPQQVCAQLNGWDGVIAHSLSTSDDHYGWLLWVPDDPDNHAADHDDTDEFPLLQGEDPSGVPAEVLAVQRYARRLGCDYVLLDPDAERIADLPTWDW